MFSPYLSAQTLSSETTSAVQWTKLLRAHAKQAPEGAGISAGSYVVNSSTIPKIRDHDACRHQPQTLKTVGNTIESGYDDKPITLQPLAGRDEIDSDVHVPQSAVPGASFRWILYVGARPRAGPKRGSLGCDGQRFRV